MTSTREEIEARRDHYYKRLVRIKNLPSIPSLLLEISRLLDDPNTSASELGRIISKDQSMVAKVLMVANSPLYGIPRKVSTVDFAIVILGFNHIKNIVVALSVMDAFQSKTSSNWDKSRFWTHSLATGVLAKRIAGDLGYGRIGEAFTAGLLHDLGISAIQRYFPNEYERILRFVDKEGTRYTVAEKSILGLTHAEVGQFLISNWNLPDALGEAVRFHHQPALAENDKVLSAIIHLADFLTQKYQQGNFDWDENIQLDTSIVDILSLRDMNYLNAFIDSYGELIQEHINSIHL